MIVVIKVYEFVGQRTGKVYAKGTKRDCLRKLHKEYPTTLSAEESESGRRRELNAYPELITFKEVR